MNPICNLWCSSWNSFHSDFSHLSFFMVINCKLFFFKSLQCPFNIAECLNLTVVIVWFTVLVYVYVCACICLFHTYRFVKLISIHIPPVSGLKNTWRGMFESNQPTIEVTEDGDLRFRRKSTSLGKFGYSCVNRIAGLSNRHCKL
jgi:hypothetical protein